MTPRAHQIDLEGLEARIVALSGLRRVRAAAREQGLEAYLVGGSVRDALLGEARGDLDVVVVGDLAPLVTALGGEARIHDRFGTATVRTPDGPVDLARARSETYARPGALPDVRAAGIAEDLARRDFSINAMAVALGEEFELLDPHGGLADLDAGLLRMLHPRSFLDDPTRALRAARYASRLGFAVEPGTLEALRQTRLDTVSEERVEAELRSLAADRAPRAGFELLAAWGLLPFGSEAAALVDRIVELLAVAPWAGICPRADAVHEAARNGPSERAAALAGAHPSSASEAVSLARGAMPVELVHARALSGEWLDEYVANWRHVRLEISGADLLAAGVPQGPAIGAGLAAALRARLDGKVSGRDAELEVALDAARA